MRRREWWDGRGEKDAPALPAAERRAQTRPWAWGGTRSTQILASDGQPAPCLEGWVVEVGCGELGGGVCVCLMNKELLTWTMPWMDQRRQRRGRSLEKEKTMQRAPVSTSPSEKSARHETWSV